MKKLFAYLLVFTFLFTAPVFGEELLLVKVGSTIGGGKTGTLSFTGTLNIKKDGVIVYKGERGTLSVFNGNSKIQLKTKDFSISGEPNSFIVYSNRPIKYGKNSYGGNFTFVRNGSSLAVVNRVGLEKYLKGVVPKELSWEAPMEAIKAQAVASRGFALANRNKFMKRGYNLDDTTACQVYGGVTAEKPRSTQGVEDTGGLIPMYNGKVANTIFGATSGGMTEAIDKVWGGEPVPYMVALEDPYSNKTVASTWDYTISAKAFGEKLRAKYPKVGTPLSLTITKYLPSGRVSELRLVGTSGETIIKANDLRYLLGSMKVKSTWFSFGGTKETAGQVITPRGLRPIGDKESYFKAGGEEGLLIPGDLGCTFTAGDITISGRGFGHGVGMSQYGAMNMAKEGMSFLEILGFYYPGIILVSDN